MHYPAPLLAQWYDTGDVPELGARYNILPGHEVHAVRAEDAGCRISTMRWGFIPAWADDASQVPMLHNARAESIAEKPLFRQAFRQRRCLIPATGFFEWNTAAGEKTRRPFYISRRDGTPLSFAGVWDLATLGTGQAIETCAVVTTHANALIEPINPRMPVLLEREQWKIWLDKTAHVTDLLPLLQPDWAEMLQVWEVTNVFGPDQADTPDLLVPLVQTARSNPAQVPYPAAHP